jgi:peptidoglycan/xylan/chitin deacetylase (PgdA/CDA1 family)
VLSVVGEAGYVSVYWTIDTLDWKPERTPEAIRDDVLKRVSSGAVILMHVGSEQTASILSVLLDDLSDAGYGFVDARSVLGGPSG